LKRGSSVVFDYSGFHDVPLGVVFRYKETIFLLLREFNEENDEYETEYSVYTVPESAIKKVKKQSWDFALSNDKKLIGRVPIASVRFDSSKRKRLDPQIVDDLILG